MRKPWAVAVAVAVAVSLTGCSAGERYSAGAAADLQRGVLAVADSAKAEDYSAAIERLDELARANDRGWKSGKVGRDRHAAVAASIALVRSDLTELQAAARQAAAQQRVEELQQQLDQQQVEQPSAGDEGNDEQEGGSDKGGDEKHEGGKDKGGDEKRQGDKKDDQGRGADKDHKGDERGGHE